MPDFFLDPFFVGEFDCECDCDCDCDFECDLFLQGELELHFNLTFTGECGADCEIELRFCLRLDVPLLSMLISEFESFWFKNAFFLLLLAGESGIMYNKVQR